MIAVWLILMIGILGGGVALGGKTNDSFAIPGTESQNAIDRLAAVFPSAAGARAQLVVELLHPRTAIVFGRVERGIRLAQQLLSRFQAGLA